MASYLFIYYYYQRRSLCLLETRGIFCPLFITYFVAAAAPVCYKHSLLYSHYTLPMTFLRPLDLELTVEIYQGLIS